MKNNRIDVLLIEDDPDSVYLMSLNLNEVCGDNFKFKMECADRLGTGLDLLAKDEYDVILLDLMLPDSQGLETLDRIRAHALNTPIVVLTNINDEHLAVEAVSKGAQDYMVKGSLNPAQLKRAIQYAIERGRLLAGIERIIENSADGMVVVDLEGVIRYVNPAAETIFGKSKEELIGQPYGYPVSPNQTTVLTLSQPNGGEKVAEVRVTETEWKNYHACLASIRDITELRRVEKLKAEIKERRRIDQLKDQLMSTVSHELRSPLTIVKAAVGNMYEGLTGPLNEAQANMVELAHKNIKRLAKIINNLLDLSRLESGRARLIRQKLDVADMLREVVKGYSLAERERNLRFEIEIPDGITPVYGDPDMFVQLIGNLVDNAARFARSKVQIRVREAAAAGGRKHPRPARSTAVAERPSVEVIVADDGPGIKSEEIGDLFNKFVQVNRPSGGGGYKGTGLGLAICKEIVERHGGKIWVESPPGRGAQFHVLLPHSEK